MVLHTHRPELNRLIGRCASEDDAGHLETVDFGPALPFFAKTLVGTSEPCLPAQWIARKRVTRIVQTGVSNMYPAFCTVTASGSIRRPAAGSFFCFGSRRLRLRFPSATDPP